MTTQVDKSIFTIVKLADLWEKIGLSVHKLIRVFTTPMLADLWGFQVSYKCRETVTGD
jgi:hypothetical protein